MSALLELIGKQFNITGSGNYLRTVEHDSLVIDLEKDIFYWNSRGIVGDAYVWLTEVENLSHAEARLLLKDFDTPDHQVYVEIVTPIGTEVITYPKLVSIFWERGREHRDYWYKRGFSDATIDSFQLGYNEGWYTLPIFLDGTFMNFQIRRDEPDKRIKSWYRGVGPLIFNSDILKVSNSIIVTESPTDAILLNQHGLPAVSQNGGADFWSPTWFKYFVHQRDIYVVYDNDKAGRKGARNVARKLGQYRCWVCTFEDYPDKYDVGDWLTDPMNKDKSFGEFLERNSKRIFE
jgi:DNA primase